MGGDRSAVVLVLSGVLGVWAVTLFGQGQFEGPSEAETLNHFQAILRLDSSNPPRNERRVVDYLKEGLDAEGITSEVFALESDRPNLVARLTGSGAKRPDSPT